MRRLALAAVLASLIAVPLALGGASASPPIRVDDTTAEATTAAGATVSFNVKAFDPISGNAISASCNPGGSGTGDFTVTHSYPLGSTTVVCTATLEDASLALKTITVKVQDTTAPSVTPPAPVTDSSTSSSGKVVLYSGATALDLVDGSLTPACSPPSGSTFAIGTTTVTCTATDSHGNTGSAKFTVTVTLTDIVAPAFTPNPPPNIVQQTSNPGGTIVIYSVAASDNSGIAPTVTCSPSSGSTFPVGDTTVKCTAEDAAHNKATASFSVTVTFVDTTPPTFSNVPANVTAEANGPGGSTVNYTIPTANDAQDGPAVVKCSPASGSLFPLGTTPVTCNASDAHGNTSTASFNVAVVDTTKPTLIVPTDSVAYANTPSGLTAQGYGAAQFLAAAKAIDLADPHPKVTNNAGALFSIGVNVVTFSASDASGNSVSKTAILEVRPMPPAETPPLPLPAAPQPPANVADFKAEAGDAQVRLSWQMPSGVDHVVVTRALTAGGDAQVVYTGSATSFMDRGVVNGLEYRYLIVSVDPKGEQSTGVAAVALPRASRLRSPKDGARLKKPPKLLWAKNSEAAYYNVQLFRGKVKILSSWPAAASLALKHTWKYQGRRYTLTRGVYRWYVWPGFGARSAVDYGDLLGWRSFEIMR